MTREAPLANFRRPRKIAPFLPGEEAALRAASRSKAAALNQHALGYGALAESEWATAGIPPPDLPTMRKYRLDRIRAELSRHDYAGALLYDPINIRYATDSTNMQLWVAHNPTRHCFVAADGPVVLFDYFSCEHLSDHSGVVDEVRPAVSWMYLYGGELSDRRVRRWAAGIADLVKQHGGGNSRLAVDHLDPEGVAELTQLGVSVHNGEAVMENARLIKSPDEILCMRRAIVSCEAAMAEMQAALRPGISENELWAELHRGNIHAAANGSRRGCFRRGLAPIPGFRNAPRESSRPAIWLPSTPISSDPTVFAPTPAHGSAARKNRPTNSRSF